MSEYVKKWREKNPEKYQNHLINYNINRRTDEYKKTETYKKALEYAKRSRENNNAPQMEFLCKCDNCFHLFIDTEPQNNSKQYNINGLKLSNLIDNECPNCKTDNFLSTLNIEPKHHIKLFLL